MLLTAGERISMALLAMALESLGARAMSFTGSQSGIITDDRHSDARIVEIRPFRIEETVAQDTVAIVAGFQGVAREKEITTLGPRRIGHDRRRRSPSASDAPGARSTRTSTAC